MRTRNAILTAALALAGAVALAADTDVPRHKLPASKNGDLVVGMCDGKTSVEVPGVKPGQRLSPDQSQAVASQLMTEWRKKNPDARWDEATAVAQADTSGSSGGTANPQKPQELEKSRKAAGPVHKDLLPPVPTQPAPSPVHTQQSASTGATEVKPGTQSGPQAGSQAGHTYGAFGQRDIELWNASTQAFVEEGSHIFHDAERLGGTVGISCDMCHPNAANTHPETYPKFQVQLGRVALLRDMINWCIENPVRGKPLHDDDPKLKALEAYILSQRKGVPLEYGKH